jgi:hypothetical protein
MRLEIPGCHLIRSCGMVLCGFDQLLIAGDIHLGFSDI